jgi:pyruvate dehydrogenase E1 component
MAYDPAYAYELAVIVQDGLRRMYGEGEDIFYYVTVLNENYAQPEMPEGAEEGILRGMHRVMASEDDPGVRLLGSGAILNEALRAAGLLQEQCGVDAEVWSVTSYKELHKDAEEADRWNRLHPGEQRREAYVSQCLGGSETPVVAASDYVKALPESIGRWVPAPFSVLGTDGFGRSDGRPALRDFFEVDARHIAYAAAVSLLRAGRLGVDAVTGLRTELEIDADRPSPVSQ